MIDRRTALFAGGSAAAALAVGLPLQSRFGSSAGEAPRAADPLAAGYRRLFADLEQAWWNTTGSNTSDAMPGIRSTDGSGGINTGRPNYNDRPASPANARGEAFWQQAQYYRFLRNDWRMTGSPHTRRLLLLERAQNRTIWTAQELASGGADNGGRINVSDDLAWACQYLKNAHEVSGADVELSALRDTIRSGGAFYRDSFTPAHQVTANDPVFSRYGMLYAVPGQDPNGQGRSSTYETGTMEAALYIHDRLGLPGFLAYPKAVYAGMSARLRHPSGIYWQSLQLDPARRTDGTPFLQPMATKRTVPAQDYDGFTIGGTMGMAVVAAELFRQTRDDRYRADVVHINDGIARLMRQNGALICDQDPWTAGVWAFDYATRCLVLPGVDPDGIVAAAIGRTARNIVAARTRIVLPPDGRTGYGYGADWSGNAAPTISGRYVSWAQAGAAANDGRGGGQAGPDQIMTASSSGIVVQAAAWLAAGRPRLA